MRFIVKVIIVLLFTFFGCNVTGKKKLEVSSFIRNFILYYLNDSLNSRLSPSSHVIKVVIDKNMKGYGISILGYEKSLLSYLDTSYFGCYDLKGYDIYFYGNEDPKFILGKSKKGCKRMRIPKNAGDHIEYDPVIFKISLYRNYKFDKMHSYKGNIDGNIEDLKKLTDKYLYVDDMYSVIEDTIFDNVQQLATYDKGLDSLLSIIYSDAQFREALKTKYTEQKVFVRFIVTKEGRVKKTQILKSSGSEVLDSVILGIVRKFPLMTPGKHRGKIVNSYLTIPIDLPKELSIEQKKNQIE